MRIGVKNLVKRESDFTRKIVLCGAATLCGLLGVGLCLLISFAMLEPSTGQFVNLLSSIIFPVLTSGYVLYYYYKHYFIGVS